MKRIINILRYSNFFSRIFHTIGFCLHTELIDCQSVLDLGCGPASPIENEKQITYSVGVEIFEPYLRESKKRKIHTKYIKKPIQTLDFPNKSFDSVLMIEVLEHMSKKDGISVLKKAEKWATKKIIISTPNGYFPMGSVDNNDYQEHKSGWTVDDLQKLGFKCYGVTGAKFMYSNKNHVHSLQEGFGFSNMRFHPQFLSFLVNALLQIVIYYFPQYAFEIFAVKQIQKK